MKDLNAYYSCDDNFTPVEKVVRTDLWAGHSQDKFIKYNDAVEICCETLSNSEGIY